MITDQQRTVESNDDDDDGDDVEVIFEKSPLYNYINAEQPEVLTAGDFFSAFVDEKPVEKSTNQHEPTSAEATHESVVRKISRYIGRLLGVSLDWNTENAISSYSCAIEECSRSKILTDFDEERIRELLTEERLTDLTGENEPAICSFQRISALFFVFLGHFVMVCAYSASIFSFLIWLPALLIYGLTIVTWLSHYSRESQVNGRLKHFRETSFNLDKCVRRCLKLLREREILSLGYTIASERKSLQSSNGKRSTKIDTCCCPLLRKTLDAVFKDLIARLQKEIVHLYNSRQYVFTNEDKSGSFAILENPELTELFSKEMTPSSQSLDGLKVLYHLTSLLRSEYLRAQLSVLIKRNNLSVQQNFYHVIIAFSDACRRLEEAASVYDYTRTYEKPTESHSQPADSYRAALHSLCLHLHMALQSSIDVESSTSAPSEIELSNLRKALRNAVDCLDEAHDLLYPPPPLQTAIESQENCAVDLDTSKQNNNKVLRVLDENFQPLIIDEVLEAFVFDSVDENARGKSDVYLEREKVDTEKRGRVLSELKSVLSVRAESVRTRELTALAAYKGITVEQLLAEQEQERSELESQETIISERSETRTNKKKRHYDVPDCSESSVQMGFTPQMNAPTGLAALLANRSAMFVKAGEDFVGDGESSDSTHSDADI